MLTFLLNMNSSFEHSLTKLFNHLWTSVFSSIQQRVGVDNLSSNLLAFKFYLAHSYSYDIFTLHSHFYSVSHYLPLTGLGYLPPKGLKDLGPLEALLSGPSKKELEKKKRKRKRKGGGVEPLLNPR